MPTRFTRTEGNVTVTGDIYSDGEIERAWHENGQGHEEAVSRGEWCAVVACNKQKAIELSSWFVNSRFALETGCHYDGLTLSIYCGAAGSRAETLLRDVRMRFSGKSSEEIKQHNDWLRNLKL